MYRQNLWVVGWCTLLQLLERCPCHILLVGRMKFASIEANLGGGLGLLSPSHFSFLSGRFCLFDLILYVPVNNLSVM